MSIHLSSLVGLLGEGVSEEELAQSYHDCLGLVPCQGIMLLIGRIGRGMKQ